MPEFNTFSLADAAQGAATIQNVRNNALAMAAAADKQRKLTPLMAAAAAGDADATRGVVAIDPELGNQVLTAVSKMNDEQRAKFKDSVETTARDLQAAMNAPDVYKDQAWQMVRQDMVKRLGEKSIEGMPEKFDPNWAQLNIDKGQSVSDLIAARGTAFQPTPAYDKDGNLVFMQGTNIPGKAPTVIKDLKPIDKVESALKEAQGKADIEIKTGAAVEGSKAAGKSAIEKSDKAIENLTGVRKNIANIDEAISAIDAGAKTGVIQSKLPSVTAASVTLDNIRSQMGLNVISGTTFGALSKGELDFALDSAIPKNLNPQDLRAWLIKKKDAQQKLSKELEDAAIYLGKPGNTPAGYLELRRNQQEQAAQSTPQPSADQAAPASSKYQIKVLD